MRTFFILTLLACLSLSSAFAGQSVGGGFTDAGLRGEYFPNTSFAGVPSFVRQDVRIDFDWGTLLPVGGSLTAPYASFPRDNFSVRWTGMVIPRFSEIYTLLARADETFTLEIKPTNSVTWTKLVDITSPQPEWVSNTYAMTRGMKYDVRVLYTEGTGAAFCSLRWSCPSAPEDVIDPITYHGINAASWFHYTCANLAKRSRWSNNPNGVDELGWAKGDTDFVLADGQDELQGTYLVEFNGQARLRSSVGQTEFFVNGGWVTELQAGDNYNPTDNTTRVLMRTSNVNRNWIFQFRDTKRTAGSATGTGITNVKFMRPLVPGTNVPHDSTAIVYQPLRDVYRHYAVIRWLGVANVSPAFGEWDNRTPPMHLKLQASMNGTNQGECLEYMVMLANECGKDLYICTPIQADNEYFLKLAQLLKYGSDGYEPYTNYVANPEYPPLNPNLRIYLEVGNEIWNWAFGSTQYAQNQSKIEVAQGTPDGLAINYDGNAPNGGINGTRRFLCVRTVRASDIFRQVFGDAAMGPRVRCVLEQQYDDAQETASIAFEFMDGYFDNGHGNFVTNPQPAKYYCWGGGGATYYGTGNPNGDQTNIVFADGGFEAPVIEPYTAVDGVTGGVWQFTGTAGIYRNGAFGLTVEELGETKKRDCAVGCRIIVGATPLYVHELGRWFSTRNTGEHLLQLVRASDKAVIATASVAANTAWMAKRLNHFRFGTTKTGGVDAVVTLQSHTEYYLVSHELNWEEFFYTNTTVQAEGGVAVLSAIEADMNGTPDDPTAWSITEFGLSNHCCGPVTFTYTTNAAASPTGYRNAAEGQQSAYIVDTGSFSGPVYFSQTGDFALTYMAAGAGGYWPGYNYFNLYINDQIITPRNQNDYRTGSGGGIGGFARSITSFEEFWGTSVFHVPSNGWYTLRVEGIREDGNYTLFDNFEVASVDEIINSGFGSGEAQGQVAQANYQKQLYSQAQYPKAYGVEVVAYEAGCSIGGDFHKRPIQKYVYYMDPRIREINNEAMDIFTRAASHLNVWGVYTYWPEFDIVGADDRPLVKSLVDLNNRLRDEETNGWIVPVALTPTNIIRWRWYDRGFNGDMTATGRWASWLIMCPKSGRYAITVEAEGGDGMEVEADGEKLGGGNATALSNTPFRTYLTMGTHGVRVRNVSAGFMLKKVHVREAVERPRLVTPPGARATPFAVTLSVATAGAEIRYAVVGTGPAPVLGSWNVYSGPIPVESNMTLLVQAFKAGLVASEVVTGEYFVSSLEIPVLSLPAGLMGQMYTQTVTATGGVPPYEWGVHSGMLPDGLGLGSNGVISGVPVAQGTSEFELIVHDAEGVWKTRGGSLVVVPEGAAAGAAVFLLAPLRRRKSEIGRLGG